MHVVRFSNVLEFLFEQRKHLRQRSDSFPLIFLPNITAKVSANREL